MINRKQISAGRDMLDWNQRRLAEESGVSLPTIQRMEKHGPGRSAAGNVEKVKYALERGGIAFIEANGGGPGVRLRDRQG